MCIRAIKTWFKKHKRFCAVVIALIAIIFGIALYPFGPLRGGIYGNITKTVLDTWEFDAEEGDLEGYDNATCRVNATNYYITVASGEDGSDNDGFIRTYLVWANNGTIKESTISSYEYDTSDGAWANVKHIPDTDKYIIAYRDTTGDRTTLKTIRVYANNGTIALPVIDTQVCAKDGAYITLCQVYSTIWAIGYTDYGTGGAATYDGYIETWEISTAGAITDTAKDIEYLGADSSSSWACRPYICQVDADTIAVTFNNISTTGDFQLETYDITSGGLISNNVKDAWAYEGSPGYYSLINKIGSDKYALTYVKLVSTTYSIICKTVTISDAGIITKSFIDTLTPVVAASGKIDCIQTFLVNDPIALTDGVMGVTCSGYNNSENDGHMWTWNVSSAGVLGDSTISHFEFDITSNNQYYNAPVIYMEGDYYVIFYTDVGVNDGHITTVEIETYTGDENQQPVQTAVAPTHTATGQSFNLTFQLGITDPNGDTMDIKWMENRTIPGVWRTFNTSASKANGTYTATNSSWANSYNTKIWWTVNTTDGVGGWDNDTFYFTTRNHTVTNYNPSPANAATGQALNPQLSITVGTTFTHPMNVTFRTNASGTWVTIATNTSVVNGTYKQTPTTMTDYLKKYWWSVNTTCHNHIWNNDTYYLTTATDTIAISNPSPSSSQTGRHTNPSLNITVDNLLDHLMTVTFKTNASGTWATIGTNVSCPDGTYKQIPTTMGIYNKKYWWSINATCHNHIWANATYNFTTESILTYINAISPYAKTSSPLSITATGPTDLTNVTLRYAYNDSNWTSSSDAFYRRVAFIVEFGGGNLYALNVTNTSNIGFLDSDNSTITDSYGMYMDIDETNKILYVTGYTIGIANADHLYAFDISDPEDIQLITSITTPQDYTWGVHVNEENSNYVYVGAEDGNVNYNGSITVVNVTNIFNETNPDMYCMGTYGYGSYGDIRQDGDYLYGLRQYYYETAKYEFVIFDISDPAVLVNVSYSFLNTYNHFCLGEFGGHKYAFTRRYDGVDSGINIVDLDVADLPPSHLDEIPDGGGADLRTVHWLQYIYNNITSKDVLFAIGYSDDSWVAINLSGSISWALADNAYDGLAGFTNYFDYPNYAIVKNANWLSGSMGYKPQNSIFAYVAVYGDTCFIILNVTKQWAPTEEAVYDGLGACHDIEVLDYNGPGTSDERVWVNFSIDSSSPWSWNFNFPNGTGYYEFYSIGKKSGSTAESAPSVKDAMCNFTAPLASSIVYVDDNAPTAWYDASHVKTINEAIINISTSEKGTIYIWAGTYNEDVIFHDYPHLYGLDIIGNGSSLVFVRASNEVAAAFFIQSESWYNISGINFGGGINTVEFYDGSNNLTIFNCNISCQVPGGCAVFVNCENCTVKNCFINGSNGVSTVGIEVGEDARFNLFYNNSIINVTFGGIDDGTFNRWNTSKTLGTSIMGGPYVGGNYYDNNTNQYKDDGFTVLYELAGAGYCIDYLPLSNGSLNATIRNNGVDYFVWLGENTTAYWVNQTIAGMDERTESISTWNRTVWLNYQNSTMTTATSTSLTTGADNDWGTYQALAADPSMSYVNYTIPYGTHRITWEYKDYQNRGNITFPYAILDEGTVRIRLTWLTLDNEFYYQVYYDGVWNTIRNVASGFNRFYEESMRFNRTNIGLWQTYNGTRTGVNWTVHTFDVIRTILDDAATQTIWMDINYNVNYTAIRSISLANSTINKGRNYTGFSNITSATLSDVIDEMSLPSGYWVAKWNKTTYTWVACISGFELFDDTIERWDVIETKVAAHVHWEL